MKIQGGERCRNMNCRVRELREQTGLSQRAFAEMYEIPVSTLRKWEQGEAAPPDYVLMLLARSIPGINAMPETVKYREVISDRNGDSYYYDAAAKAVYDRFGNLIYIHDDLKDVDRDNLALYLHDLFQGLYDLQNRFENDCDFDRKDKIKWQ